MTRRQGIMGMLGGIFAGPEAAKEVASTLAKASRSFMTAGSQLDARIGSTYDEVKMIADKLLHEKQRIEENIAQARDILNGKFTGWQKDNLERNMDCTRQDISSLKSITKAAKERMFQEHTKRRERESYIREAQQTLERLLNWKLGGKNGQMPPREEYPSTAADRSEGGNF